MPQRLHPINVLPGALIRGSLISAAVTSCHPRARNQGVLILTKSVPLLLYVVVGSAIEGSLLCSDERSRMSPAPDSKPRLTDLSTMDDTCWMLDVASDLGIIKELIWAWCYVTVSCEQAPGLCCRKANQDGKKKLLDSQCLPNYIHDMMRKLTKNNAIEKLAEIDEIGFGFLRLVPNWSVKQVIMVHLAKLYEVKTRTFILDVSNIHLNAELIGRIFDIPSRGDPFPSLNDKNPAHVAIKKRFHRRTTTELWNLVYSCPIATESDRMKFRRYFLLVVMKMFLCLTTQQVILPWHIYPVLDVSNPRRFNWLLQTLKSFDTTVEKYKLKRKKTCEGCMFVMLRLQYGRLDNCHEPEPWLAAWTSESLENKAQYIIFKGVSRLEREKVKTEAPPVERASRKQWKDDQLEAQQSHLQLENAYSARRDRQLARNRSATKKKGGVKKDRSRNSNPKPSEEKDLPMSPDDDEDNEPLAKRRRRLFYQGVDQQKTSSETAAGNLNQENTPHETTDSRVPDVGTLSVALVQHQEWEFDGQVFYAKLFFVSIFLIRELGNVCIQNLLFSNIG
ncbi:hypothetical protein AHAS_Ahas20G0038200 [Arachis hypogaea]